MGSNIENVQSHEKDGMTTTLDFLLMVHGRQHLAQIIRRLRANTSVLRIYRVPR